MHSFSSVTSAESTGRRGLWIVPGHALAAALVIAPILAALAPLGLAALFTVLAVLLVVLHTAHRRPWAMPGRPTLGLVAAFLGWCSLSAFWTIAPAETLAFLPRLALNLLGAFVMLGVIRAMPDAERAYVETPLMLGVAVGGVVFIIECATDAGLMRSLSWLILGEQREFQYGSLGRGAAFFAIFGFLAALVARRRFGTAGLIVFLAGTAVSVAGAHGYKALLAVGLGILTIGGAYAFGRRLPSIVSAALVLLIATSPLQSPVLDSLDGPWTGATNASVTHRLIIWRFVGERIAERPALGWGLNSARAIPGGQEDLAPGTEKLPLHPHNAPLQLWLELGAIGAFISALCLALAAAALCRPFRSTPEIGLASAAIVAATGVGAVGYGVWQGWWLGTIWITAATLTLLAPAADDARQAPNIP